jgi:hypothetical protein
VTRRQQKADVIRGPNRIQGWIDVDAPEFRRVFKAWDGLAALWVLDTVPFPADVGAYPFEDLVAGLLEASHHRVGRKRAQALVTAYRDSMGMPGHASARTQLAAYWAHWRAARAALAATEAAQQALVASVPGADALREIPGVGPVIMATLSGGWGNLADSGLVSIAWTPKTRGNVKSMESVPSFGEGQIIAVHRRPVKASPGGGLRRP